MHEIFFCFVPILKSGWVMMLMKINKKDEKTEKKFEAKIKTKKRKQKIHETGIKKDAEASRSITAHNTQHIKLNRKHLALIVQQIDFFR